MRATLLYDLAQDRQTELLRESARRRLAASVRAHAARADDLPNPAARAVGLGADPH